MIGKKFCEKVCPQEMRSSHSKKKELKHISPGTSFSDGAYVMPL
jgi:hypothetical protein